MMCFWFWVTVTGYTQLENMYIYEMFSDKFKIPHKKKLEMIKFYIKALPRMSEIEKVNIDPEKIE